ncbi:MULTISPECIES: mycofactocin-coupled SDR family oxidoreductase [Rhodococcus]|uniref:Mycofactocin-coupled SDR family oxidoreductase n=1 Tax=Rhodococcus rhodochrous TaxID=1829 RepID=A0AAW4XEC9_RHORH|nr:MULTISPECIES: mycofactocin-coupled SDR family oxidoreductase [Rhodococcus]MCD2111195.1 mycofactocin-coupled SDR family oxidoreductase [Rhodococcus rhodochrous]QHG81410.1 NAD(P)-dependent oxidoreductase [Rhodococcus rhodochrous]QOH54590.1 SDR family mycofactocin-dependent oxidoreductase [Rhodococcus rhodochrous]WAL46615.1 mycofactocin-coupled SDR family oxidoreductase [Rhodococcus pyridinivorans]
MGRLQDKVVFVTGVARGQGRTHAVRLAREGAKIIGVDLCDNIKTNAYPLASPEDLTETTRLVEEAGGTLLTTVADVRDRQALFDAVQRGAEEFGRLDGIVAQAGICPLGTDDPQAFMDAFTVDFVGVVNAVEAGLPHLADGGSIVATGSLAALLPGATDNPTNGTGGLGYSLAKRMISSFVNDLSVVLGPKKIRVNAVHPTNCNTDMLNSEVMYRQFRPDLESPTLEDALPVFPVMSVMNVPYVEPEDVTDTVLFLLSDESRYITGMQMRVDAGGYVRNRPATPAF